MIKVFSMSSYFFNCPTVQAVLWIRSRRICRICIFLVQIRILLSTCNKLGKTLFLIFFDFFFDFLSLGTDVNVPSVSTVNKLKYFEKKNIFVGILSATEKKARNRRRTRIRKSVVRIRTKMSRIHNTVCTLSFVATNSPPPRCRKRWSCCRGVRSCAGRPPWRGCTSLPAGGAARTAASPLPSPRYPRLQCTGPLTLKGQFYRESHEILKGNFSSWIVFPLSYLARLNNVSRKTG